MTPPHSQEASEDPVIVAGLRSPIGTAGHGLAGLTAAELAAPVLAELARRVPAPGQVVLGNCTGPGGNLARVAALTAGLPVEVPALTVDGQCGSGLAAVGVAAAAVAAGRGIVLAGGVESASTAPRRAWPPRGDEPPVPYTRAPFAPADIGDPDMGLAADLLAEEHAVGRRAQDEYAARSHQRACAHRDAEGFVAETVPVAGLFHDERPRSISVDRLARLPAAFRAGGTVTAGNSCGVNDGAALVALADTRTAADLGLPGLRVRAFRTVGVDPNRPGLGMVPAVAAALDDAGLGVDDIDVVELNEAFAGQVLACAGLLGLAPERVCEHGGALALGHPWGASGAVLAVRLFHELVTGDRGELGLAAVAVGGGQGVAMVVQRCR